MEPYDVVVIGYGVSGLCLGSKINTGKIRTLIVEQGNTHFGRNHEDSVEALIGCGGAGLFSDGKFSFYPAGTEVWNLSRDKLIRGYQDTIDEIKPFMNIQMDDLDNKKDDNIRSINDECDLKTYPSYYLTLQERLELIQNLVHKYKGDIIYKHRVKFITKSDDLYNIEIENICDNTFKVVSAKYVVFAGGKYNSLYFPEYSRKFLRIEYGARIVAKSDNHSMTQDGITDPKYIFKSDKYQARTFCWCKNGEFILTDNSQGIKAYSGRSDVAETDMSNFGLNIRLTCPDMKNFQNLLRTEPFHIKTKSKDKNILHNEIKSIMGTRYGEYFCDALEKLLNVLPNLRDNIDIVGPTIEGVGYYPDIDPSSLQIYNENLFVCGDASGIFRGIIASMISGYFIAHTLNEIYDDKTN